MTHSPGTIADRALQNFPRRADRTRKPHEPGYSGAGWGNPAAISPASMAIDPEPHGIVKIFQPIPAGKEASPAASVSSGTLDRGAAISRSGGFPGSIGSDHRALPEMRVTTEHRDYDGQHWDVCPCGQVDRQWRLSR